MVHIRYVAPLFCTVDEDEVTAALGTERCWNVPVIIKVGAFM